MAKTTRREVMGGAIGLCAAMAAGRACAQAAGDLAKVRVIGAGQGFNWLPVFLADEQGFFKTAGIQIEYVRTTTVDRATAAVRDGTADLAITPPEGAIVDHVTGGDLRIIAANSLRLPMSLVATKDIPGLTAMRGKRVGTSSLTEGTALYTQAMLKRAGLNYPGDYQFVLSGVHTARWTALQKGEIDAAPQPAPWNFLAERDGYRLLGEVNAVIPEYVFGGVIGKSSWIEAHRDLLRKFLGAMARGHVFVNNPANDAVTLPVYQRITIPEDAKLAAQGLAYTRGMGMWPNDLVATPASLKATIDLMIQAGLLAPDKTRQAQDAFDFSLLKA